MKTKFYPLDWEHRDGARLLNPNTGEEFEVVLADGSTARAVLRAKDREFYVLLNTTTGEATTLSRKSPIYSILIGQTKPGRGSVATLVIGQTSDGALTVRRDSAPAAADVATLAIVPDVRIPPLPAWTMDAPETDEE